VAARAKLVTPAARPQLVPQPSRAYVRHSPRRRFRSRVVAIQQHDRAMRVLVGRDLSTGGMRIEPNPDLRPGEKISLALFGGPEERIVLRAEVARNDAEAGLSLRFLDLGPEVTRQLEALVSSLPHLERVDGPGPVATVMGEITTPGEYRGLRRAS